MRSRSCGYGALLVALTGCGDGVPLPAAPELSPRQEAAAVAPDVRPEEAELHRLSAEIPGFGGYYFDPGGDLVAYVTEPGRAPGAAGAALRPLAERALREGRGSGRVVLRRGAYDIPTLARLRDRVTDPLLGLEGVVSVDLDEARNRVVVGIADPAARGRVQRTLADLAVDAEPVLVEEDEPAVSLVSNEPAPAQQPAPGTHLASKFDSITGGVAIAFQDDYEETVTSCSAGFMADFQGVRVFFTSSLCSKNRWTRESTVYHQPTLHPLVGLLSRIGVEHKDLNGSSCGFLSTNSCRYSDASVVRIDSGKPAPLGRIARTRSWGLATGSREIDPANPYFRIERTSTYLVLDLLLDKMGAGTGWTRGRVTRTCVDTSVKPSMVLRCQVRVALGIGPGDGGSPVFRDRGDGRVDLYGILWGRASDGSYAIFSPISGIEKEFGALNVGAVFTGGGTSTPPGCNPTNPTELC